MAVAQLVEDFVEIAQAALGADLRFERAVGDERGEQGEIGREFLLRARVEGMKGLDPRIIGRAEIAERDLRRLAR